MDQYSVTFEQNVEQYDVTFEQNANEFTVQITNEVVTFTSEFSELGKQGLSAYEIAVQNGFVGSENDYNNRSIDGGLIF